MSSLCRDK